MEPASQTTTLPMLQPRTLPSNSVLGGYVLRDLIEHDGCIAAYRGHAVVSGQELTIWELFPTRVVLRGRDLNMTPNPLRNSLWIQNLAIFARMGKALTKINHDNLVPAINFIEAHGTGYILSNLVLGERIDALHTRLGGFSDLYLADLAIALLSALQCLHACGMAHGDVHEKNVHCRGDGTPVLGYSLRGLTSNLNRLIACGVGPSDESFPADVDLAREKLKDLHALSAMLMRYAGVVRENDGVTEPDQLLGRSQSLLSLIAKPTSARDQALNFNAEQWRRSFERLREQVLVPQSQGKRQRLFPTLQAPELRVVASTNVQSAFESSSTNLEESIPPTIPNVDDVVSKVSATAADNRRVLAGMAVACAALIAASLWQNISSKMDVASPAASLSKNPAPEPTTANQPPVVLAPELPASRAPISDVVNDRVAVAAIEIAHDTSVNSTSTAPAESPAQQARGDQSEPAASTDVSSLLNAAEADLRARRLTLPAGNNAVEKYRAVLKLEPKNAEAHRGLQRVGAILLARAQKQLAAGDFDASVESLRRARTIDPGSARIGELEKSLAERKRVAQTPRIPQPYPPVFKSLPPAPLEVVAPPVVKEANRAEQLRQRLGGIQ